MEISDPDPYASLFLAMISLSIHNFDISILFGIVALLLLLGISALVSGSETAFFSLRPAELNSLKEDNDEISNKILKLREMPKVLLATILIVNNLVNVAIVILSSYISIALFDFQNNPIASFLIQVIAITSLILIFGEIIPKIYASKSPLKVTQMTVRPLSVFVYVFKPLSYFLVNSISFLDKRFTSKADTLNMSDLSAAIEITTNESTPPEEKKMLKGIVTFGEKEARSVMKSRVDITAIDSTTHFEELLTVILDSGYSRIPVYETSLDKVLGMLYIKDLLPFLNQKEFNWLPLIRPAFFVPENKKINDLLQEFREKKIHLAIVVDEYGGTAGLLTLEDIIEEIVGDISDEFDRESDNSFYVKVGDQAYIFEGRTNLLDFSKVVDIDDHYFDDVRGESDTLAGLLLELEGRIPEKGVKIKCRKFLFEVREADARRIKSIYVSLLNEENEG